MLDVAERLSAGDGVIVCTSDRAGRASLSCVSFSYPLKVITPSREFLDHVQAAWLISYGGGLVGGDRVRLKVVLDKPSTLVLLTQGSTKVFKARSSTTMQHVRISVAPGALVVVLPAPVTCFARARYDQRQSVHLADDSASVVLLDWYTSGRMSHGDEAWEFDEYTSDNEIWIDRHRVVKDVLSLQDESTTDSTTTKGTSFRGRVEPYSCYATLYLYGPATERLRQSIAQTFDLVTQYQQARPFSLVWSYSALARGGGVARCAAHSTEAVHEWVAELLDARGGPGGIEELIGKDLYKTALA